MKDENALIDQAKRGDEAAFTELYNKYRNLIRYIIWDLVKDSDLTEDLLSITFTKAFEKIQMYTNPISFQAWLKTIAVNTVIDWIRINKKKQILEDSLNADDNTIQLEGDTTPESELIMSESISNLKVALSKLRAKYRKLLELRYFENMSYEELSAELDIPIGTIKSDLNKAKKRLKTFYQTISKE